MNSTLLLKKNTNIFFKKINSGFGMFIAGMLLILFSQTVVAQVSTYVFDENDTALTYSPITGTDLFGSNWNDNVSNQTIPFTFNFNGVNYTSINISSNGFITFGATAPGINTYNPLSAATTYAGAVSAFGQNLLAGSPTSSISYTTLGVSPNRVFVIQYSDVARVAIGTGLVNFQIHLYETSNIIEVWYNVPSSNPTITSSLATSRVQLGLRGANNAHPVNVFNRRDVTTTAPIIPTANGTAAGSTIIYNANTYNQQVTRFRWSPPCYAPSGLTAINLTGTTADISWTAPAIAPAGYEFEVRSSGAPGSGPVGLGDSGTVAGTSTTVNGLTEGFTYTLYVRSSCGGSNNSAWVTGPSFTLPCAATTVPYYLPFDPVGDGFTVPGLPVCTVNDNAGAGNNWQSSNPDFGAFFDEHLTYSFHPTNDANTWFITKGIALTAGQTYRIQYIYGGSSEFTYITNRMEVRYGTTGTAAGLAGAIQLDDHPEIKSVPQTNIINFTAPTTDTYYFGFRAYSEANNGTLYLDDIFIDASNCGQPTGLIAPAVLVSFNNATITWTAPTPSPTGGYAYYYNTTGVPPTNATPASGTVPAGTTLTVIPGLSPSTTYYVWVRSVCGFGDLGEWSSSATFTTLVAPPVYCTPVQTGTPDPNGITNVTMGSINNTTGLEPGGYGDYSGLTTNVAQGATIPVAITYGTGFTYDTNIWVDWNNDGDFADAGELVYTGVSTNAVPTTLNASFTVPIAQPLGPRRLRIGGIDFGPFSDPCRTGTWQAFEDYTVNVIVAPPALTLSQTTMPAQCGLTPSPTVFITSTLSDFDVYTWTPSTGVTGDPVSGYVFNTSATTTFILTASQTSGAFSTNSVNFTYTANETPTPITISTPDGTDSCINGPAIELNAAGGIVSNITVYQEDFNSGINGPGQFTSTIASTGGSSPANSAWTVRANGYNSGPPTWFATFNSNDNSSFVLSNSDAQGSGTPSVPSITRTRLISPSIDLTAYTTASVSFYHHLNRFLTSDISRVQVTTDGGTNWTDLISFNTDQGTPTNFVQAFLDLNPYVGNIIQIRFDYQANWGYGWAIDNFRVLGSATSAIVWSPTTGLYTDAAATIPYTGTGTSVVYAMPATDQVYTATATAPGPTFCESTQTVAIVVTPQVGGTLSADQVSCDLSSFTDITLSGHVGNVIRWEYADDAAFTLGVNPIANTTTTLTPAEFGTFLTVRYFRAVIGTGACNPVYSSVASVSTNTTILTGTNTWSNGTPDISKRVVIAGDYTASANFSACSVQVLTGATLTVQSGVTVTVENEFTVDGPSLPNTVVFENNASLIQLTDAVNSGAIRYERNSTPIIQYDYTYWSSPVANQVLGSFSPNTNPARFYIFNSVAYAWQNISNASVMNAGQGYIIRAPGTFSTTVPAVFNGAFYGVPHNGPYSIGITVSGTQNRNLLGNPYPSAIDADLLYLANSGVLQGNMFFWTHNTPITANNYNANDYATYNATGGAGTAGSPNPGVNPNVPTGNIAAGQGFFVQGLASGTVNFDNTMRLTGLNDLFYRSPNAEQITAIEKHRIWVNIINQQGAYKQMLLGYVQGATNAIDNAFDANLTEAGNVVSLYSINDTQKLTIQGRALPFDVNDEVPLGFRTSVSGNYSIELENFDGLFEEGQNVYLEDKWLNVIHNLKESNYDFTTESGTFEDRFEIQFTDGTLGVNNPTEPGNAIVVYKNNETIFVNASNLTMTEVKLFDIRGRLITAKQDILASEVSFANLNVANQLILVQITTIDGEIVTKKVAY